MFFQKTSFHLTEDVVPGRRLRNEMRQLLHSSEILCGICFGSSKDQTNRGALP